LVAVAEEIVDVDSRSIPVIVVSIQTDLILDRDGDPTFGEPVLVEGFRPITRACS
jgi:hypothetical protein